MALCKEYVICPKFGAKICPEKESCDNCFIDVIHKEHTQLRTRIKDKEIELATAESLISTLEAERDELRVLLRPFAHTDLWKNTVGQKEDTSIVFQKDKATLMIIDFKRAYKILEGK